MRVDTHIVRSVHAMHHPNGDRYEFSNNDCQLTIHPSTAEQAKRNIETIQFDSPIVPVCFVSHADDAYHCKNGFCGLVFAKNAITLKFIWTVTSLDQIVQQDVELVKASDFVDSGVCEDAWTAAKIMGRIASAHVIFGSEDSILLLLPSGGSYYAVSCGLDSGAHFQKKIAPVVFDGVFAGSDLSASEIKTARLMALRPYEHHLNHNDENRLIAVFLVKTSLGMGTQADYRIASVEVLIDYTPSKGVYIARQCFAGTCHLTGPIVLSIDMDLALGLCGNNLILAITSESKLQLYEHPLSDLTVAPRNAVPVFETAFARTPEFPFDVGLVPSSANITCHSADPSLPSAKLPDGYEYQVTFQCFDRSDFTRMDGVIGRTSDAFAFKFLQAPAALPK